MNNSGERETDDQRIDCNARRDATRCSLLNVIAGARETRRRRATRRSLP